MSLSLRYRLQDKLKRYPGLYNWMVDIFCPIYSSRKVRMRQKELLEKHSGNGVIINLGSGVSSYGGGVINCDICPYKGVDVVCDASAIPVENCSADLIINIALLEHVKDPQKVVDEMLRILKDGGELWCFVPFLQPYHAAPSDYYRWTGNGARELYKDFASLKIYSGGGPTSSMLWVVQEWLAILLSFGSHSLKDIFFLAFMVMSFPLKYLDMLLDIYPCSDSLASGYYIHATKSRQIAADDSIGDDETPPR